MCMGRKFKVKVGEYTVAEYSSERDAYMDALSHVEEFSGSYDCEYIAERKKWVCMDEFGVFTEIKVE